MFNERIMKCVSLAKILSAHQLKLKKNNAGHFW